MAKTSLSAGSIIRELLMGSTEITELTEKIFPVVTDEAELPYIVYRRAELKHNPTKAGSPGADTVKIEILCCTGGYAEGVELAELVREALEYSQGEIDGLIMRSCVLEGSEERWEDDAFVQQLDFIIKI